MDLLWQERLGSKSPDEWPGCEGWCGERMAGGATDALGVVMAVLSHLATATIAAAAADLVDPLKEASSSSAAMQYRLRSRY